MKVMPPNTQLMQGTVAGAGVKVERGKGEEASQDTRGPARGLLL